MALANEKASLKLSAFLALVVLAIAITMSLIAPPRAEAVTNYLSATVVNGYEAYSSNANWQYNRRNKAAGYGYCLSYVPLGQPHASYSCSTAAYDSFTETFWSTKQATCKNTSGGVIAVNCWYLS